MSRPTGASPPLRVLVVATFDGTNANVIRDYLFAFRAHSRHQYFYLFDASRIDRGLDLSSFDVILVFWSVYLLGPFLSASARGRIREARAAKILFLQDEYRDVRAMNAVMAELGVQLMFTCVAEKDHAVFYPRELVPSLEATHTVLTGYVPESLAARPPDLDGPRSWDVGYRSRDLPYYLGDLAREKRVIGERFKEIAARHGFTANISTLEADRLYGKRWTSFLRSSRFVLGTASGASVVDFTGEVRRSCERHLALHPGASYEEVKGLFFADVDGKVVIETASPRIFEAAAFGCVMVQHEGNYAGLLEPDRSYIQIRRDYSNVDEVVARMKDAAFCRRLARNAHADLVASGRWGYRAFAERFDGILEAHGLRPVAPRGGAPAVFHLGSWLRHGENVVPFGDGFVYAPSRAWLGKGVRGVLDRSARRAGGPFLARFATDPAAALSRAAAVLRLVAAAPRWRRVVAASRRRGPDGAREGLPTLLDDIDKMEVVRGVRDGSLRSRVPFGIRVDFDATTGTILLASVPGEDGPAGGGDVPAGARAALERGEVRRIVWDHTPVSQVVVVEAEGRSRTVWVGTAGVRTFDALASLCGRSRDAAAAVLASLQGRPG